VLILPPHPRTGERPGRSAAARWRAAGAALLAKDDPGVAAGLIALLEMDGIEASWSSAAPTPSAHRAFEPDAVVLDVGLPDISASAV